MCLFLFFILFWGWSVGGPSVDPVRSRGRGQGVSVFGLPLIDPL